MTTTREPETPDADAQRAPERALTRAALIVAGGLALAALLHGGLYEFTPLLGRFGVRLNRLTGAGVLCVDGICPPDVGLAVFVGAVLALAAGLGAWWAATRGRRRQR